MDGEPARPVVQLQLQAQPGTGAGDGAGDVLRYADTRTDRLADQLSADREMTWRLARANGWAATGVGVLLAFSYLGTVGAGTSETLVALAPLLGLAAPGWALLAALGGIRAGRRGPVITALAAGALLGCAWAATAVGVLFVGYRAGRVAAYVTPAIVAATLLIPAGILVYHAVRVLAVGGRGGQRDQTSGLSVAVPATDQDLWRFIGRISMLRLAGGVGLFLLGVASVAATRMRPVTPPPPRATITPYSGDFFTEEDGLATADRQRILDLLDRDGWMGPQRRQMLDDLLRQAGRRLERERVNFAWDRFAPVERKPSGASGDTVEAEWSMDGSVSILWFRQEPRVVVACGRYVPGIFGDAFVGFDNNRNKPWIWSHGALERWAAKHIETGNAMPTREQMVALAQLLPPPRQLALPDGPTPPPKLPPFEAATLPDRTLRVTLPGDDPLYIDTAGTADKRTPQERAAEAAAEPPPPAYFPVSWAWPLPLAVIGLCEIVAALVALSRSRPGRNGTPVPLTPDEALRLLAPQAALGLAAAVALALVSYAAYDAEMVRKQDFFNAQFTVAAIAIGGWIFWTALALPRRAIALAGAPR